MTRPTTGFSMLALAAAAVALLAGAPGARADVSLVNGDGLQFNVRTSTASESGAHYAGTWTTYVPGTFQLSTGLSDGCYICVVNGSLSTTTGAGLGGVATFSTTQEWGPAYGVNAYWLWVSVPAGAPVTESAVRTAPQPGAVAQGNFGTSTVASVEGGGRELVMGPENFGGLLVSRKVFVPAGKDWVRHLIILKNPTGGRLTADLVINGFSSTGPFQIDATESGDTTVTAADRWVTTSGGPPNGCCEPKNFHNMDGPGGMDSIDAVTFFTPSNTFSWQWNDVVIPAGKKRVYAFFVGAKTTRAQSEQRAKAIDKSPLHLANRMSASEINNLRNWDFGEVPLGLFGDDGEINLFDGCTSSMVSEAHGNLDPMLLGLAVASMLGLLYRRRRNDSR